MTGLRALVEAVREARAALAHTVYTGGKSWDAAVVSESQIRDTILVSERALANYLLSTPDVLAAVEAHPDAMEALAAVRALGEARVGQTAVRMNWRDGTEGHRERVAADQRAADARDDLFQLADRLAARKGE